MKRRMNIPVVCWLLTVYETLRGWHWLNGTYMSGCDYLELEDHRLECRRCGHISV